MKPRLLPAKVWRACAVLLLTLVSIAPALLHAQSRVITGRVLEADSKRPLSGVKVLVKGSNQGTLTGKDGTYQLTVTPAVRVLVFNYVGMKKQEITLGEGNEVNVTMGIDTKLMDEVVVTAMGIERERRAINYAVQEIKASEIAESAQQNVVNTLQGRIAGVQITNAGGAPGAGASIIIRGGNSVDSDNQPLFVVDGIPIDNSSPQDATSNGVAQVARSISASNRAMDINPDDIETISVLKGPAAAALYGLRAANGVVLITTKRGFKERMEINYSNAFSWDEANKLPETQSVYKQGTGGFYDPRTRLSFGPRFQEGEPVFENLKNFFVTGFSQQHNLTLSGASERLNYYFSASSLTQNGIVPNTSWGRTSFRFNGGATVAPGMKITTGLQYTNSGGNRVLQGAGALGASDGYMASAIAWPKNDDMRNWENPDGSRRRLLQGFAAATGDPDNPYFTVNRSPITDDVDRFLGTLNFSWDMVSWLNFSYRAGFDITNERNRIIRGYGSSQPGSLEGSMNQTNSVRRNLNSQAFLTAKFQLAEDLKGDVLVGNQIEIENFESRDQYSRNFINPDFVGINNTNPLENRIIETIRQRRLIGVFANANLNWRDKLYIGLSARNDWSSTLPVENRSFFYYSGTLGYIFSEDLGLDFLNFGRFRGSYSRVGKDAAPYRTGTALTANTFLGGGFRNDFWGGNPGLKPETTEGIEAGLDLQFLENRIGLDVTLYQQTTYDQLIAPRVSQASGFIFAYLNGGTVRNQGIEVLLNLTPVRSSDFTWTATVNFTRNVSTVVELPAVLQELNQSASWVIDNARGSAFPGQPLQAISVNDYDRDPQGRVIVDSATGTPRVPNGAIWKYGGNRQPDAIIGINNAFTFDNFTFSFLWDIRVGGAVMNGTEWWLTRFGMSTRTLDRYKQVVIDGVYRTWDGQFVQNTRPAELTENYYRDVYARSGANFVEDGSWVRLRTVNLSYRFPKAWFEGTPINNLEITLTGRNLLLFTRYTGMDPEVSAAGAGVGGAGSNGMDFLGVPATRGITAGLRIGF